MARIPILADDHVEMGKYLCQQKLPSNYMEDFTVLGFVSDRIEDALTLLTAKGFDVHKNSSGAEITVALSTEIVAIRDLLTAHGINCSYRDIAETIYQA